MNDFESDAAAIEASLQRPAVFGQVFERHWDAVFRFFERRVGSGPAEDLASEVFRIAFERRSSYETGDSSSCRAWLYGIAGNLALKERRRLARYMAAVDRFAMMGDREDLDHASAVVARVDTEETWLALRAAFEALDDTSREMLLLIAWEGLSYGEVAAAFSIPVGTVRSRLYRIRARLRPFLDPGVLPVVDIVKHEKGSLLKQTLSAGTDQQHRDRGHR